MYGTINFEGELKLRNETEFKTLHQRIKYIGNNPLTGEDEEKSFIMTWLYDETARQYEKLEFLPKQDTPNIFYNSFSGFEVEKQHEGDIKLNFEDSNLYILLNNLCGNDPKVVNYVLKWIANRVQKPYEITKVALLFKSLQGAGKNLFWDWVGKSIIGQFFFFMSLEVNDAFLAYSFKICSLPLIIPDASCGSKGGTNQSYISTSYKSTIRHRIRYLIRYRMRYSAWNIVYDIAYDIVCIKGVRVIWELAPCMDIYRLYGYLEGSNILFKYRYLNIDISIYIDIYISIDIYHRYLS
jgi:hypothetical protein